MPGIKPILNFIISGLRSSRSTPSSIHVGLRQVEVCEQAASIPSLEVIMKLALALETPPDEFLTGTIRYKDDEWRTISELLRPMSANQLKLAKSFLTWLSEQET